MRRREVLAGSLVALSGGLAGCIAGTGGDGDADTTATGTTAETTTAPESSTTTDTSATDAGTDGTTAESGGTTTESGGTTTESGGTTESSDGTTAETTTASAGSDSLAEQSFRVTGSDCGDGANEAKVEFGDDAVTITGVIRGADSCHRARLARVATADAELTVVVETYREDGMCSQCLTDVAYEATLRPADGLPDRVVVRHDTGDGTTTVAEQSR